MSARSGPRVAELGTARSRLLADALTAEERERRAIAEGLHDHAIQSLLSARHELEEAGDSGAHPSLARADGAIATTVDDLREAVFELHPYVLDQAGLAAALRTSGERVARRGRFTLDLDFSFRDGGAARAPALRRRAGVARERGQARARNAQPDFLNGQGGRDICKPGAPRLARGDVVVNCER